jgi:tetratricopeptide (TPR) repeat protein
MPRPNKRFWLVAALGFLCLFAGFQIARALWAAYHVRRAQEHLDRGDFPGALSHLRQALGVRRRSPELLFLAGRTARRAGEAAEAERYYDAATRDHGNTASLILERTLLTVQMGDIPPRLEHVLWADIQDGHPEREYIYEALTRGYYATYLLPKALYCVDQWLKDSPDQVQALYWRALVYEGLRRAGEAEVDYRRALELNPEHDEVRLHLAQMLLYANRPAAAREHLERLRQRQPDNAQVLLALGRLYREAGQHQDALPVIEQLLQHHPDSAEGLRERGRLALTAGQDEEALEWFRRSETADPYDEETVYFLFQCLAQRGKADEAKRYQARLKQIGDDLQRLGELNTLAAEKPTDPAPRWEAATICFRNGQEKEAIRWLTGALLVDPGHEPSRKALEEYRARSRPPAGEGTTP